jgi:RNA 2',3'-cyclic 3'-phosphodiesterase
MSFIRTFIAVDIDSATRKSISRIQDLLKSSQADIKFIEPDNIHITLIFLGNINSDQIQELEKALKIPPLKREPFKVLPSDIGCFPNEKNPRILWLGIAEGRENLIDLNRELLLRLEQFYPKEKRAYKPHITIGRLKSNKNIAELKKRLSNIPKQVFNPIKVDSLSFIKSKLSQDGPKYEVISELKLLSG